MSTNPPEEWAICPDCEMDMRNDRPHCPGTPDVEFFRRGNDQETCELCHKEATWFIRLRWQYRPKQKYVGMDMYYHIDSYVHWSFMIIDACGRCKDKLGDTHLNLSGYGRSWDAIDTRKIIDKLKLCTSM